MYYTKKRIELIRLLSMPELPDSFKIEKLTIVELRVKAKERGLRGFWKLTRDELVDLLYPTGCLMNNVHKESQISNNTNKNENKESNKTSDIGV